jgi:hypothetical protein
LHGHIFYLLNRFIIHSRLIFWFHRSGIVRFWSRLEIGVPTYCGRDLDGELLHIPH